MLDLGGEVFKRSLVGRGLAFFAAFGGVDLVEDAAERGVVGLEREVQQAGAATGNRSICGGISPKGAPSDTTRQSSCIKGNQKNLVFAQQICCLPSFPLNIMGICATLLLRN